MEEKKKEKPLYDISGYEKKEGFLSEVGEGIKNFFGGSSKDAYAEALKRKTKEK